ncbi:MAG: hypothetical protein U1E78_12315 [Gammaproteobacteria bacterium]
MKLFGNKSEFAIEYGHITEFYPEAYPGRPDLDDEFDYWVSFWVKGKNLFESNRIEGVIDTYWYDLNLLIEFFCEGLPFQLQWDPVPAKGVHTKNHHDANILVRLATFLDQEDYDDIQEEDNDFLDCVDFNLYQIQPAEISEQIEWGYHHKLITARQASFLPNVVIARHYTDPNKIEICYQSAGMVYTDQYDYKYEFTHPTGVALVDIKLYKQVIVDFCLDFINCHKNKHPKRMGEYMEKLKIAMTIEV